MSILVPRFYNTNIVYDNIPANSILTLDSNSYSHIPIQNGVLTKSNNTVGFTNTTGLLYGSTNDGVWTLNSTSITHGILINSSNAPVFNPITGLIYGKNNTNTNNWNIDSVPLRQGVLTMSNNNNTSLSFTSPTNVLYATNTGTSWTLNGVDDITNYTSDTDYVLYYGKHDNNTVPHWRALTITGKNFSISGDAITAPWKTLLINKNTNNFVAVETETFNATEYGVFNNTGKVVKLSPKIMNDIGFKIFSPSEINEQGILTANIIIYNSSTDNVSLPVNYFSCLNFHSKSKTTAGQNISESMRNTSYTDGFYNYTAVSNNLPIYDSIKNTYNGFYSYIYDNNITSNDYYIHYTTSIDIDSIRFPTDNTNYYRYDHEFYTLGALSNYKIIIGVFTNFSEISSDMPYYKNIFFCNVSKLVISQYDTHVLLGYLIVDLKDINKTTGIVNIKRQYDIDSTVPVYNTKIDTEELKNGALCFRPLYYMKQDGTILSLYYNDKVDNSPLFRNVNSLTSSSMKFISAPAVTINYNEHYTYNNDKLRFNTNKVVVDSNTSEVYVDSTLIIPSYMAESIEPNQAVFNKIYCDVDSADPTYLYPLTYYFKPFSYYKYNEFYLTNDVLGYTIYNPEYADIEAYLCNVHITSYDRYLKPHTYVLNNSVYASNSSGIYDRSNPSEYIITDSSMYYVADGYIHVIHNEKMYIDNYNNVCYNGKVWFTYGTYMDQKLSVDTQLLYIDENSNVHLCVSKNGNVGTSDVIKLSGIENVYAYKVPTQVVLGATIDNSKIGPSGINSNIYTINGLNVYETRPFLYKNDYTLREDIILKNNSIFQYIMNKGVLYNNEYYIFNANEAKLNVIGQIVISGDKYKFGNVEGIPAIINTITSTPVVTDSNNNIINNHHIEITNSNFIILDCKAYQTSNSSMKCLCERLCPSQNIVEYDQNTGVISIDSAKTDTGYYSYNFDNNNNTRYYQNLIISTNFCITGDSRNNIKIEDGKIVLRTYGNDSPRDNSSYAVITGGGVYINNTYATTLVNNNNIVYTDDYVEMPFFDTPVEKDMQINITPITKYTILAYNNISYSTSANTLSNIIGYKISLCNIHATLTSYVGEYPSIIN